MQRRPCLDALHHRRRRRALGRAALGGERVLGGGARRALRLELVVRQAHLRLDIAELRLQRVDFARRLGAQCRECARRLDLLVSVLRLRRLVCLQLRRQPRHLRRLRRSLPREVGVQLLPSRRLGAQRRRLACWRDQARLLALRGGRGEHGLGGGLRRPRRRPHRRREADAEELVVEAVVEWCRLWWCLLRRQRLCGGGSSPRTSLEVVKCERRRRLGRHGVGVVGRDERSHHVTCAARKVEDSGLGGASSLVILQH